MLLDTGLVIEGASAGGLLMGAVTGGWLMARAALAAQQYLARGDGNRAFHQAKLLTARFYAEHVLATAPSLLPAVAGGSTVMAFDLEQF